MFALTDLKMSLSYLEEKFEIETLAQERPEFEAQRKLMEADIFHLEEAIERIQDELLSRVS